MSSYSGLISGDGGDPVGAIVNRISNRVRPDDFLLECDGSAISRTTYSELFAVIGTVYGVGDGSTTFNLPDYRDRFLRGWPGDGTIDKYLASRTNNGSGGTGDNQGTKQTPYMPTHWHNVITTLNNIYNTGNSEPRVTSTSVGVTGNTGAKFDPINTTVKMYIRFRKA